MTLRFTPQERDALNRVAQVQRLSLNQAIASLLLLYDPANSDRLASLALRYAQMWLRTEAQLTVCRAKLDVAAEPHRAKAAVQSVSKELNLLLDAFDERLKPLPKPRRSTLGYRLDHWLK